MMNLWQGADGRNLAELLAVGPEDILARECQRAALACLAEAGLLERESFAQVVRTCPSSREAKVSVIIVVHNHREWLPDCLASLASQTCSPVEILVVDNASTDGLEDWLAGFAPNVRYIRLRQATSLANALNRGMEVAQGDFFLLLNPDVKLEPEAIDRMVAVAEGHPSCAAVAAKLKFLWVPSFLNGVGNFVGAFSWGTDIGIGHLDLGQFDAQRELPSACFAAVLIPVSVWRDVGPLDEHLPLYYEDTEWCYRARLKGYSIHLAAEAVVYHAMGSRKPMEGEKGLSSTKLRQVVYGRLRFATKLLGSAYLLRFLLGYWLEDVLNSVANLLLGRWRRVGAYLTAWTDYLIGLRDIWAERKIIQMQREIPDATLFHLQQNLPPPLVWRGTPLLTRDIVLYHYLPFILEGKTRSLPEFQFVSMGEAIRLQIARRQRSLRRAMDLVRYEGLVGFVQRMWRGLQGWLMRP
jgi:GT2 family glycosyltransferase